jgi:transposase
MPSGRHLSEKKRIDVIRRHGNGNKSISQIGRDLKVSRKAVAKWIERYNMLGSVRTMEGRGRKRSMDDSLCKLARDMLTQKASKRFSGAEDVAKELHRLGKTRNKLSRTCIIGNVKQYCKREGIPSITTTIGVPKKKLTAANMAARLRFCELNLNRDWKNVMFSDRCKFFHYYPGCCIYKSAWRVVGEACTEYKVNRAATFNVYGGITKHGTTRFHVVAGTTNYNPVKKYCNKKGAPAKNITSEEYHDVVSKTFLPDGERLFNGSPWVLQQDNDPTHAKASRKALQDIIGNHASILDAWPPNSPDLNIIEK